MVVIVIGNKADREEEYISKLDGWFQQKRASVLLKNTT
jgi:hypothetical protein